MRPGRTGRPVDFTGFGRADDRSCRKHQRPDQNVAIALRKIGREATEYRRENCDTRRSTRGRIAIMLHAESSRIYGFRLLPLVRHRRSGWAFGHSRFLHILLATVAQIHHSTPKRNFNNIDVSDRLMAYAVLNIDSGESGVFTVRDLQITTSRK